ncbi:HicB family protein [Mycolicibacterium palauense]|uniref:HicB family protein n=1 Tax=Mycolicibacterium palauense TaxID=2034511 RepID=UPI000BFEAD2A|nr:HicB family protein [Mycolicibacterium palauense]
MNTETKALEYSYRIHWSPDERGYIASVAEFPSIRSAPAPTPQEAARTALSSVQAHLSALAQRGEPGPAPHGVIRCG